MKASTTSRRALVLATVSGSMCTCLLAEEKAPPQIGQLTKEHKMFKHDVGTWDAKLKIWEKPGDKPIESEAVEKNQLLPGGYWLLSRFDGAIGPVKFSGHGVFGYDPTEKKFVGLWVDNMNPHPLTMKGDYDAATKTLTMLGENREPDGKKHKSKEISRWIDDNTKHFELHMQGDDGKFFKMMEIEYKRRPKEKKTS
jgi:hypothetical protein